VVVRCRSCGAGLQPEFRFCPSCAAPTRSKLIEAFEGHRLIADSSVRTLRVSHYLGGSTSERHTRVSVWRNEGVVEAAISLDEDEVRRLAAFLECGQQAPRSGAVRRLLASARGRAHAHVP
jgi:uncharacterized OB-fold protein